MKAFYTALKAKLKTALPQIAHFNKWNNQLVNIADEVPFPRPALFIEIEPVQWEPVNKRQKKGNISIIFHLVTDSYDTFADDADGLEALDLTDIATREIERIYMEQCTPFINTVTGLDNDHGNLIENKVMFTTTYKVDLYDGKEYSPVTPELKVSGNLEA